MADAGSADLLDTRDLAAPRALVFAMWTEPRHLARWFGPHGSDMPRCEIDARPGGAIRFDNRFLASGDVVRIAGVFDEVVAPERLRFTFTFVDERERPAAPPVMPDWPIGARIEIGVELTALSPRTTRMVVRQRAADPAFAAHPIVVLHGRLAIEGWRQTAERLLAYLEGEPAWEA